MQLILGATTADEPMILNCPLTLFITFDRASANTCALTHFAVKYENISIVCILDPDIIADRLFTIEIA